MMRPKIPSDAVGGGTEGELAADLLETALGNLMGWRSGATFNVNRWLGITADFAGYYKSADLTFDRERISASASLHTFLVGPKFTRRGERVNPYVQVLVGTGRVNGVAKVNGRSVVDEDAAEFHISASVGGGVEIPVHRNIVVRAIELDYFPYVVDDDGDVFTLNNIRWGSGISLRF